MSKNHLIPHATGKKLPNAQRSTERRGTFLSPDWTLEHLVQTYPLTRLVLSYMDLLNPKRLKCRIGDVLHEAQHDPYLAGRIAYHLNNTVGSYYGAPLLQLPSEWLHEGKGEAPAGFWSKVPHRVKLTKDRTGTLVSGGLPVPYQWAVGGVFGVRYAGSTGELDEMSCWNLSCAPRASQVLFSGGFLKFGTTDEPHAFDRTVIHPFGFLNRQGDGLSSAFTLEDKSLFLHLKTANRSWVALDWRSRKTADGVSWRQLGWDKDLSAHVIYVCQTRNFAVGSAEWPPYPEGVSQSELLAYYNGMTAPDEESIDRLVAGNMYLFLACGGEMPEMTPEGLLKWSCDHGFDFQITSGITYQEGAAEFKRARDSASGARSRCLGHCREILSRPAMFHAPGHPNLEAITATAPLLLDALKLDGNNKMRFHPASYLDTHVDLMSMRAFLYSGDYDFVDRFLSFISKPSLRGPDGQLAMNYHYDWTTDVCFHDWVFQELAYLALIGHLHWHSPDDRALKHYETGRTLLLQILKDTDHETGLFLSRGYWPDLPQRCVGRKGRPWPAQEAGVWYEALRNWELLALSKGDSRLASQLQVAAEKVRKSLLPMFLEPEVGLLCDSVDPVTRKKHPHYSSFHLYFLYGMFGQEILNPATARRMADAAFKEFHSPSWKAFRTSSRVGPIHADLEHIEEHWTNLPLAKLFRLAGHARGLAAIRESYEFHYGKFLNFPEYFNMIPSMTMEQHGSAGWMNYTMATRYQVILEAFYGIHLTPHNLGIWPTGLDQPGNIENLPVGKSRWDFVFSGKGLWPTDIRLNNRKWEGAWCFPCSMNRRGHHTVQVTWGDDAPPHPVLLESVGLELLGIRVKKSALHVTLKGPGRGTIRFFSPQKPKVYRNNLRIKEDWDPANNHASVSLSISTGKRVEILLQTDPIPEL